MEQAWIDSWHAVIESPDADALDRLLDDDVVFWSPVVHSPQRGKAITSMYLMAAATVLGGDGFTYVREVAHGDTAVLEFTNEIEGIHINGVDMIRFNDDGRIVEFKVMVRPLKAIQLLHRMMGEMLAQMQSA